MLCHHNLETWLLAYDEGAGLGEGKGSLFRSGAGRTCRLSKNAVGQGDVFRIFGRRVDAAGIRTRVGCHNVRATSITEYLWNGGPLEVAQ